MEGQYGYPARAYPTQVSVKAGEKYYWCRCGLSSKQPFCDGSHKGTKFTPVVYEAKSNARLLFCMCKTTKTAPLCDKSHINVALRLHGRRMFFWGTIGVVAAKAAYTLIVQKRKLL